MKWMLRPKGLDSNSSVALFTWTRETTPALQGHCELGCGKCRALRKHSVKGSIAQMVTNANGFFCTLSTAVCAYACRVGEDLAPVLEQVGILTRPHHVRERGCTLPVLPFHSTHVHDLMNLGVSLGPPPELLPAKPFSGQGLLGQLHGTCICPKGVMPRCSL